MDDIPHRSADRHLQYDRSDLELTFIDAVTFLWRNKFLIAVCMTVSAGLAVLYVLTATPLFTANARVLIESRLPINFREQISENLAAMDTPAVESQIAILHSERIAEKVVLKAGFLDKRPDEGSGISLNPINWMRSILAAANPEPADPGADEHQQRMRGATEYLWNGMSVNRLGLSYVIEISYSSPDRDLSARVANMIADSYIEDQLETRAETARQGSIWLEKRIDTLRQQMNDAALRVKEFKARRDYRFPTAGGQTDADGQETAQIEEPATTLEDLETQASTYRKIYESYLQSYTESVQTQSYPVTNTRVITRATRPNGRSYPRGMNSLIIGIVLGGMFGVGLALVLHSVRRYRESAI